MGLIGSRRRNHTTVGTAVVAALVIACGSARAQECVGDCDGNATVEINELVRGVNINLGLQAIDVCPVFDCEHTGTAPALPRERRRSHARRESPAAGAVTRDAVRLLP